MSVIRPKAVVFSQMARAHRWMVLFVFISVAITAHAQDQKIDNTKNPERWFYQTLESSLKNNFDASAKIVS
jgi:hypothetical protein